MKNNDLKMCLFLKTFMPFFILFIIYSMNDLADGIENFKEQFLLTIDIIFLLLAIVGMWRFMY